VVQVVAADEKAGWVYFTAHGDRQRPYDTHLYRVDLEGNRLARLTEATGQHDIQFAPSKAFFLDTHSTVDRLPTVELRRADGTSMQTLSKANIDDLRDLKWTPPEEFVVKAADGKTDLYGVLYKPYDFDPNKKYPVIDGIHGNSALTTVPRTFIPRGALAISQARAQLGFVYLIVDARGTPERGREFREVLYGNHGRIEIPDHVAALQQLADTRPYMDLSRVGIDGHSYGGYFAIRAMLLAPDVYHVGVASAPMHMQGNWGWDSVLLGNKEAYEYASNLNFAANLKGKLLIIHGTSDACVPFSNTMKMVDALIRAGKRFDLLVMPGQGHDIMRRLGRSELYWLEAITRYLQEHLKP
jgi:dipeptidyl aminopeptidase/acylaminoacyl peptidase